MEAEWLSKYKEVDPEEMVVKPFCNFHKDWALLTSGNEEKCNSMTISWGNLGTYMSKPMCGVYVRQERFTKEFMDKCDYFTVCNFPESYRDKLKYMGNNSGRNGDKYKATGLTPIKVGNAMALKEANIIYICKKMFHGPLEVKNIEECENKKKYYDLQDPLDFHSMYLGEVEKILVLKE